jgi:hypothetical protein
MEGRDRKGTPRRNQRNPRYHRDDYLGDDLNDIDHRNYWTG